MLLSPRFVERSARDGRVYRSRCVFIDRVVSALMWRAGPCSSCRRVFRPQPDEAAHIVGEVGHAYPQEPVRAARGRNCHWPHRVGATGGGNTRRYWVIPDRASSGPPALLRGRQCI